jgi:hypothetical protein
MEEKTAEEMFKMAESELRGEQKDEATEKKPKQIKLEKRMTELAD